MATKMKDSMERMPGMSWVAGHEDAKGKVGAGAFLIGFIISIIGGIFAADNGGLIALLVILGLLVGFLNVTAREIIPFLIAATALVIIGTSDVFEPLNRVIGGFGDRIDDVVTMIAIFAAPAAVVQALLAYVAIAKPGEGVE
ncbi:MAG: hypothetical protein FJ039_11440 [Chloroflexi bacterium]|nr:hypothetical protein [Chloroflexota bacterium]